MGYANVNLWAVLVTAILSMVFGAWWYSPKAFGKQWMKSMGVTMKEAKEKMKSPAGKKEMTKGYIAGTITAFVTMYVLGLFVNKLVSVKGTAALVAGLQVGLWVWLGFIAATSLGSVIWEKKPFKMYLINSGYALVQFAVAGAIFGVWQ